MLSFFTLAILALLCAHATWNSPFLVSYYHMSLTVAFVPYSLWNLLSNILNCLQWLFSTATSFSLPSDNYLKICNQLLLFVKQILVVDGLIKSYFYLLLVLLDSWYLLGNRTSCEDHYPRQLLLHLIHLLHLHRRLLHRRPLIQNHWPFFKTRLLSVHFYGWRSAFGVASPLFLFIGWSVAFPKDLLRLVS